MKAFRLVGEEDLKLIGFLFLFLFLNFFPFFNFESGFASRTPSYLERFVAGALESLAAYVISILSKRRGEHLCASLSLGGEWNRSRQVCAWLLAVPAVCHAVTVSQHSCSIPSSDGDGHSSGYLHNIAR